MTVEHFERTLRSFHRRKPFRSFTVELVRGDRFEVDHPEALGLRAGVAVFVAADSTPIIFDHESVSRVIGETEHRGRRMVLETRYLKRHTILLSQQ